MLFKLAAEASRECFGSDLAHKVAKKLLSGLCLKFVHRDYCGHGLSHDGSRFILATYLDGTLHREMLSWPDQEKFIEFLKDQSDFTMSGASTQVKELAETQKFYLANQTITKARLIEFVS